MANKKMDQAAVVMKTFHAGKLRDSHGKKVTDMDQAMAIAMSEKRAAKKRGTETRTWRGRTRQRPRRV